MYTLGITDVVHPGLYTVRGTPWAIHGERYTLGIPWWEVYTLGIPWWEVYTPVYTPYLHTLGIPTLYSATGVMTDHVVVVRVRGLWAQP